MAFAKYASAKIVKPDINAPVWDRVLSSSGQVLGTAFANREASKIALTQYNPKDYMLSHCTIVASVDTENGPGQLGQHYEGRSIIDRKYADYYITPETSKFVNNNQDSWERKLLLSSFRSFVGGENYVEHLQIPEMSKGKIIDAAARDIGDSIYVDILVATHRKFKPLVASIQKGDLQTLSMGCFLPDTQVSLADGRRVPIQDIQPGDLVLTHKGRHREVLNQQIRYGTWRMRTVEAVGLSAPISATDNHPFFVLRPATECACGCGESLPKMKSKDSVRRMSRRFKRGHDKRVLNPNNTYSLSEYRSRKARLEDMTSMVPVEVRADELQEGDILCIPRVQSESGFSDEDRAELLGYFLAEGSFLKRGGVPVEVQFNFALDEKNTLVARTVELLARAFPEANPAWVQDREDHNASTVHVTGGGVADWFRALGGEYSHLKTLAADVMTWAPQAQKALLRAWLQGDGGARKSGGWVGTTTSYNLACQLSQLFANVGVHARFDCVLDQKSVAVQEAVNGGVSVVGSTGKKAYFNLCLPDAQVGHLGFDRKGDRHQHLRVTDTHILRPIRKITPFSYEGWVYDLEVEEDHSYVVEGVAVHNCNVGFTICSQCGNVAVDETQLCTHIRYQKGNTFIDELGKLRKIAELCGHIQSEPGSVKFIEASWVANPAFTGAVLRNILSPEEAEAYNAIHSDKVVVAMSQPARVADSNQMARAARSIQPQGFDPKVGFDFGQEEELEGVDPKENDTDPMEKAVSDMADHIRSKAIQKIRDDMSQKKVPNDMDENENDTLIKQASQSPEWRRIASYVLRKTGRDPQRTRRILLGLLHHKKGGWKAVSASSATFSGREVLAISRVLDALHELPEMAGEARLYRTVLAVGGSASYENEETYLTACSRVLGRQPTETETQALIVKGKLFDLGR